MKQPQIAYKLSTYRYEFLLIALLLLIFDKIFFTQDDIYLRYIWPLNMLVISLASYGIFIGHSSKVKRRLRNGFSLISLVMPFLFIIFYTDSFFLEAMTLFFIAFYLFIFWEVMHQITRAKEVRMNIIIGSLCGYMLLSMVALFNYILVQLHIPDSFHGISQSIPSQYIELSYFSFITFTSIGFGDIYPINNISRLIVAFFGMVGQFYMVAVVGIIISKFTSRK